MRRSSFALFFALCLCGCDAGERGLGPVEQPVPHAEAPGESGVAPDGLGVGRSESAALGDAEPVTLADLERLVGRARESVDVPLIWPPAVEPSEGVSAPTGEAIVLRHDVIIDGTRTASLIVTVADEALEHETLDDYFVRMRQDQFNVYVDRPDAAEREVMESFGPIELDWGLRPTETDRATRGLRLRVTDDALFELCVPVAWSRPDAGAQARRWRSRCRTFYRDPGDQWLPLDGLLGSSDFDGLLRDVETGDDAFERPFALLVGSGETQALALYLPAPGGGLLPHRLELDEFGTPSPTARRDAWREEWVTRSLAGFALDDSSPLEERAAAIEAATRRLLFLRAHAAGLRSDSRDYLEFERGVVDEIVRVWRAELDTSTLAARVNELSAALVAASESVLPVPPIAELLGGHAFPSLEPIAWRGRGYELDQGVAPAWRYSTEDTTAPDALALRVSGGTQSCDRSLCTRSFVPWSGPSLVRPDGEVQVLAVVPGAGPDELELVVTSGQARNRCAWSRVEAGLCAEVGWAVLRWPSLEAGRLFARVAFVPPRDSNDEPDAGQERAPAPWSVIGWLDDDGVLVARGDRFYRVGVPTGSCVELGFDELLGTLSPELRAAAGLIDGGLPGVLSGRGARAYVERTPGSALLWIAALGDDLPGGDVPVGVDDVVVDGALPERLVFLLPEDGSEANHSGLSVALRTQAQAPAIGAYAVSSADGRFIALALDGRSLGVWALPSR